MTDLERKLAAFRPSWERLGAPADRLGLWTSQQLVHDARRLKERGLLETRYRGGCLDWRLTAQGIEAGTGETTQIGSTEGENAVAATGGETPEPGPVQDDNVLRPHSTASHAVAPEDVERMDRPSQKAGATCRDPRPSVQDDDAEWLRSIFEGNEHTWIAPFEHARLERIANRLSTADRSLVEARYHELIFAVSQKYEGEDRHETALRYIREREADSSIGKQSADDRG